jgi:hypothetical protein
MRIRTLRTAVPLTLLLALSVHAQESRGQEDCFNDDHRLSRNDLEPPMTSMPALVVSDQDISRVLAAITEQERRVRETRTETGPGKQ